MNKKELKILENMISGAVDNAWTLRRELINKIADDTRNIDEECGYPVEIGPVDYQKIYDRNGVGTRVTQLLPEECWNVVPEIIESEEQKESKFEDAIKVLVKDFSIYSYLQRIDVLSGVGRYGILLIGISDGKKLDLPVDGIDEVTGEVTGKKTYDLLYLRPFNESILTVDKKEIDLSSPRYNLPTMYSVKSENIDGSIAAEEVKIHWSRVVHVADNRGVSETFGIPRMQTVYNNLLDIKKVLGGSAEMFWKGAFPGFAFEVNPERKSALTTAEKTALRTEFENYSNKLQRYLALVGITAKSLTPQVADPSNHWKSQLQMICIALGVPYRIFMGSEEAKLASTQDTKTWNRRVKKRQESYLTPYLIRPVIDRLMVYGVLPMVEEYFVKWPDIDAIDPKDEATIARERTEAMSKYVESGASQLMGPHQYLTLILGYTTEEAKDIIKEADEWQDDSVDEGELENE